MSLLPPPSQTGAALVTGASSGIGEEIARELARRGHQVILVARRADRLQALADSLGHGSHVVAVDLTSAQARADLPRRVDDLGLTVDVLINNAGMSNLGGVTTVDVDAELTLVELDVAAVVDLCSRFVPGMVERGRGAVLNVASVGGFGPVPWQASYGAAKAFVVSYTEAISEELKGTGVTASVVCPGPVRTGFGAAAGIPDDEAEKMLPKFLWEEAADVARTAVEGLDRGRRVIVPGTPNRVAATVNRFMPRWALLPMLARSHPGRPRR